MRYVLKSSAEVMHYWANQVQPDGKAGNVFFRGSKLFSFGDHFCIARILPNGFVAFTTRKYSMTTSGHVGAAKSVANHLKIVYCNDPSGNAVTNMAYANSAIVGALTRSEAPRIRQTTRDKLKGEALTIAEQANEYLAALSAHERGSQLPIDVSNLEGIRDSLIRQRREAELQAIERDKNVLAELADSLVLWRTGAQSTRGLYHLPAALRINGDTVETSHGAEIPVADAQKLWPLIQRVMKGNADYTPAMPLGNYRLTQIKTDGSIVVGCHDIAYEEIRGIAVALSLVDLPLAA